MEYFVLLHDSREFNSFIKKIVVLIQLYKKGLQSLLWHFATLFIYKESRLLIKI